MNIPAFVKQTRANPFFLIIIPVISILAVVIFPLYAILYQYPAYTRMLRRFTENEATAVAGFLSSLLIDSDEPLQPNTLNAELLRRLGTVRREEHFLRLRIYSPSGVVVYSSAEGETGRPNRNDYFRRVVESRRTLAVEAHADDPSLEGEYMGADLVEVYVPIVRKGRVIGIFEMYYDNSEQARSLRGILNVGTVLQILIAALLMAAVLISTKKSARYLADRQRLMEELHTLSLTDPLTGLYNRRGFTVLAEQQIKIAMRAQRRLLMVSADLDGLKRINDGLGHHEGDRAIIDAARILRDTFRGSDIIGRIGGDEFVALITDIPDGGRDFLFDRLQENFARHNIREKSSYALSISAGIVEFDPRNPLSLAELLVESDKAMYSKKLSRSSVK